MPQYNFDNIRDHFPKLNKIDLLKNDTILMINNLTFYIVYLLRAVASMNKIEIIYRIFFIRALPTDFHTKLFKYLAKSCKLSK